MSPRSTGVETGVLPFSSRLAARPVRDGFSTKREVRIRTRPDTARHITPKSPKDITWGQSFRVGTMAANRAGRITSQTHPPEIPIQRIPDQQLPHQGTTDAQQQLERLRRL